MRLRATWVLVMVGVAIVPVGADAAPVMCMKNSGVVVVRDPACKKKETPAPLAEIGLLGPQGAAGPQGATGPQGPQGDQGIPGGSGVPIVAGTSFSEGPAQSTGTTAVTIVSTTVTVGGAGRIVAIGSTDAYCIAGCVAANDFVDGYLHVSSSDTSEPSVAPRTYFYTSTNQTNSITRTVQMDVTEAGTYTLHLRGRRSVGGIGTTLGFYRGQLQVVFLPN